MAAFDEGGFQHTHNPLLENGQHRRIWIARNCPQIEFSDQRTAEIFAQDWRWLFGSGEHPIGQSQLVECGKRAGAKAASAGSADQVWPWSDHAKLDNTEINVVSAGSDTY